MVNNRSDKILIVDDNAANIKLVKAYLATAGYEVDAARNGLEALEKIAYDCQPDLVILDVMMPGLSGYEVCQKIKANPATRRIPVVMLTALQEMDDKVKGFEAGADEFLSKPVERLELLLRVKALLRSKHLNEDLENARDVIYTLALALEANDPYTRGHSERVSQYGFRLAQRLELSEEQQGIIRDAGILHDIGKIGISEAILQKPGPLTADELNIVRDHPVIGEKICKPLRSANLLLTVIRHHQERYDGAGYPDHLRGEEIPVEARVISVVDSFDAMTSPRSYRLPLSYREAVDTLKREAGKQWDPAIVKEFVDLVEEEHGLNQYTRMHHESD